MQKTDEKRTFWDQYGKPHILPEGEEVHFRVSAYVLVTSEVDDKVLLVKTIGDDMYVLAGGGINPGEETIKAGARRECLAETGYHVGIDFLYPFIEERYFFCHQTSGEASERHAFTHAVVIVFGGRLVLSQQQEGRIDPKEITWVGWVPLAELNAGNCHSIAWPFISNLKQTRGIP